jgi:hypothetical protein
MVHTLDQYNAIDLYVYSLETSDLELLIAKLR